MGLSTNTLDQHHRRVRRMLFTGAALMVSIGAVWSVFFVLRGVWSIVAIELGMLSLGVAVAYLTVKQRTRLAFALMAGGIYTMLCVFSFVFDIPDSVAPRSTHHYFLVLALASMLVLRDESPWIRNTVVGVLFLTYVVVASTVWGLSTPYRIPDEIRISGTWTNTAFAMLGLYALVHIMVTDVAESSRLEIDMRKGINREEFFLVYQAQVTSEGRVLGAEALLRWKHPQQGLISPGEFIDLAEQTGLIIPLGAWVLRTACVQLVTWSQMPELAQLNLSVNVSARQFHQKDFVDQVQAVLQRTGANPQRLKLELTESMLVQDMDDIVHKMEALRAIGVSFSLDDFGTGYSSLNYLKRLPLEQIKIDQSFVRDVLADPNDAAIANTIITLGKSLGFAVVAEGVETQGQRDFLLEHDCHIFQGYLFSRPIPSPEFVAFVRAAQSSAGFAVG
ncbi:EAL domain-containing protein [Rhodoferax saidenbachensis]|uniref:EAL domain-containing protein (Putative c-di-GMP-specific phosphodiesterase class I)/drug/metabolite transporter superfamily protein YnfA n=1 Tax=Rhodoferax saidenbachensis TaxID=1484693 RepID=A0ABU1ZIE2_9BURK|nr:EAL domain-containing protein [Rhodoferax saidenbachensis]MDR7305308.1 EAL domain-containing protein (putative c-di-GMP-specific phosphodiesterase class I)/drug/metabolite transporter superfamily protein YnfA [Rhodoferax saidenbachensis]